MSTQIAGQLPLVDDYGRVLVTQTSVDGYKDVKTYRATSQKHKLLGAFADAPKWMHGFTAEEAAAQAGLLRSMYWCRVTELKADGLVEPVTMVMGSSKGDFEFQLTRAGVSGNERLVYRITPDGLESLRKMNGR